MSATARVPTGRGHDAEDARARSQSTQRAWPETARKERDTGKARSTALPLSAVAIRALYKKAKPSQNSDARRNVRSLEKKPKMRGADRAGKILTNVAKYDDRKADGSERMTDRGVLTEGIAAVWYQFT
jgi:hypothetical protein